MHACKNCSSRQGLRQRHPGIDPGSVYVARFHQRAHHKSFHSFQTGLLKLTKAPAIGQVVTEDARGSESWTNNTLEMAHAGVGYPLTLHSPPPSLRHPMLSPPPAMPPSHPYSSLRSSPAIIRPPSFLHVSALLLPCKNTDTHFLIKVLTTCAEEFQHCYRPGHTLCSHTNDIQSPQSLPLLRGGAFKTSHGHSSCPPLPPAARMHGALTMVGGAFFPYEFVRTCSF